MSREEKRKKKKEEVKSGSRDIQEK